MDSALAARFQVYCNRGSTIDCNITLSSANLTFLFEDCKFYGEKLTQSDTFVAFMKVKKQSKKEITLAEFKALLLDVAPKYQEQQRLRSPNEAYAAMVYAIVHQHKKKEMGRPNSKTNAVVEKWRETTCTETVLAKHKDSRDISLQRMKETRANHRVDSSSHIPHTTQPICSKAVEDYISELAQHAAQSSGLEQSSELTNQSLYRSADQTTNKAFADSNFSDLDNIKESSQQRWDSSIDKMVDRMCVDSRSSGLNNEPEPTQRLAESVTTMDYKTATTFSDSTTTEINTCLKARKSTKSSNRVRFEEKVQVKSITNDENEPEDEQNVSKAAAMPQG